MYKYYINRISGFFTFVIVILFSSNLYAQYISGPTTVTLGQYADYYFEGASLDQVVSASWSVDYGSVQGESSGVNYVSASFSFIGINYIIVDYFNGFYWDQVYLQVEVVDSNVSTPILSSVTQPSCTTSTGSFAITNYNGSYNYTVNPSNEVIISGSIVTAPMGSYTITATSGGYSSSPSSTVTVNAQPTTPATPTVGSITQPTDANPTGSVVLSNLPSGNWIINPGNVSGTGTTKTITGLIPDTTYNFTVTNTLGCVSNGSAAVEINIQPSGAVKPTLSSVTHPSCTTSTGSFTITNYNASHTYAANPSAGVSIAGATVTAPTGSYTIMATSASGINSFPSASITVNAQPATPTPPIIGTITQPTVTATGSVVLSNLPPNDNWVINPGNISGYGSTVTITGLAPSVQPYKFTVTNTLGCVSGFSANVVVGGYCGISDENYIHTITPTIATSNVSNLNSSQKIEGITYYDGIGRPVQKIGIRAGEVINDVTNTMVYNDIINPIVYDEFGRQTKEYLPYSDTFNCGSFRGTTLMDANVISFYNTNKYENTLNPYSEKQLEASPLNRLLKQATPGNDWKLGNGHEIKMTYQTNTLNEVKNFGLSLSYANNTYAPTLTLSSVNGGYYTANELYKTVTYDENTTSNPTDEAVGSTVEFKNKQGQVVLKRTYGTVGTGSTNEKHDTYYVYDDLGNLSFVLPPKMEASTASITTINNQLSDLGYQYKYDNRNRLVEKKLPGKQWEFIVYDKLDRVVATGPALSPFSNLTTVGWMITKYDVFSRPVLTGWLPTTVTSTTRATLQSTLNGYTTNFNETKTATNQSPVNGVTFRYTTLAWPQSGYHVLTVNYYDDYNYPNAPTVFSTTIVDEPEPVYYNLTVKPKGLPTATWTRVLQSSTTYANELSYTFYDKKARPIRTYSTNFLAGYTYIDSKLDFTGKPKYTITYHKRDSNSPELKTKDAFTYSPQGRLLTQTHQIGTGAIELIVSNTYDELGQLVSKKVGNNVTTPTQKIDYTYNVRGWLKGINDITGLQQSSDPKDLFAFQINYNTIPSGISGVDKLYNGNIAETQWKTNNDEGNMRTYGYQYDNLNRLRAGIYKKQSTVTNLYNESMDYDKNGNIMHLKRYGSLNDSAQTLIDNLTYNYANSNNSNQLTSVDDTVGNNSNFTNEFKNVSGTDYSYDANGNMLKDLNKGIGTTTTNGITYNHLNLQTKITFGSTGNIVYIYNAAGQKVQKVVTQGSTTTTTDYLGGYQYVKINSGTVNLKFFPTAEGYVEPNGSSYKYVYQYKDHLGNVRLSYDKTLAVQEENDYYPFGLKHSGYGYTQVVNSSYKYKYNGKELQDELGLNWYDYQARNYDPAIGRWMNIDPLTEKMRKYSPYTYAWDNPVIFVDYDGMFATPPTDFYNLKGQQVKHVEDGKTDKKLVLTTSKKEADVDKAISKGEVVAVPSNEVISKMDEAYSSTEKTGKENGFVVATDGTTSTMKEGSLASVRLTGKYNELTDAGKTSSYDVHTHPNGVDANGEIQDVGAPSPSGKSGDVGSYGKDGPNDSPSVVLGYEVTKTTTTSQIGGTTRTDVNVTKQVGFYNENGQVGKPVDYKDLRKAADRINNPKN